ncbi:hypothetical protein GPL17_33230 [Bradyrhizobium yuanmingense]|uniref:hypothetical protein n=1 Tax=Bradyrhizobium yuanmingense TaxID=108015 RepID=UPI0012F8240A|nr:hypothetical protein [Bradyrhizobium yuanmingense]MVT55297.1 hypothetical protein [Bradyrhizobium yuanmingense]
MALYGDSRDQESSGFFTPESPFLETPGTSSTTSEFHHDQEASRWEADSPFLQDIYTLETSPSPMEVEFSALLSEMYDETFNEVVREMAAEAVAQNIDQLNGEIQQSEAALAYAENALNQHFAPLAEHAETMLEQLAQALGRYDIQSLTEAEVDRIAEQFHPPAGEMSPTFEQFLGKLWKKATGLVKGAVNLAKKGIGAVAKMGLGPVLNKLKKLVWPLLKRVVQFAIGKLPANLRPLAQKLASKLLGTRETEAFETQEQGGAIPAAATGEHVQFEFDIQAVQLLFATDEAELEEFVGESLGASQQYADPAGDLYRARERLIGELRELQQGGSAGPAIQNFLPAALVALQPIAKIALTIIGRQKVVNFLAGFLAKLIQRFIGPEGATMLSRAVADVGLRLIGLEVSDQQRERLGYETLAATLEQTVTNLVTNPEYIFEDETLLEAAALEAFEGAVQTNFPAQFLKPELQLAAPEGELPPGGSFVLMPLNNRRKYYRKYLPPGEVTIQRPAEAREIKTFGVATLEDFFRDQLMLPDNKPVKAKLHVYEAVCGTWLGHVAQMETRVGGLGTHSRDAYYQFHPLTNEAAVALRIPGFGNTVPPEYLAGREAIALGQRFYYLEIPGLRPKPSPASYVRIEIDLKRFEIRFYVYFSEKRSQEIAQQLRTSGTVAGALQTIKEMLGAFLETLKRGSAGKAIRVIRETLEPEQLTMPSLASVVQGAGNAAGAVGSAMAQAVSAATGAVGAAVGGVRASLAGGIGGVGAVVGGTRGGIAGAVGGAALDWLVGKVLDWTNQALAKWLVANKDLFIKQAGDPSKKGVTIVVTYSPPQDVFRRLLTFVNPGAALYPSRIELFAGQR